MFAKLFSRITESSLMEEEIPVRYTFVIMLAIADSEGYVVGTDVAIARRLNMPVKEFQRCVGILGEPDASSNSKDHDGRRVIASDSERGYLVVNYSKYRELTSEFQKRKYMREYMREYRQTEKASNSVKLTESYCKTDSNTVNTPLSVSESVSVSVSGKGDARGKGKFEKPDSESLKLQCAKIGLPESEAERFLAYYESNGWRVGKNPMRSWPHALQNWKMNYDQRKYENREGTPRRLTVAEERNSHIIGAAETSRRIAELAKGNKNRMPPGYKPEPSVPATPVQTQAASPER